MERTRVLAAIQDALAEVLQRDDIQITEETRLFEDLHLDSTSVLTLLMALEDALGIEADPEALDMDDFRTVHTFANWIGASLPLTA
ncbi:acyl carrier protein [Catenuloplanes indicus]|uniref:Acyl carrier protein n=1 Tax=Catenuloplanes indicus TaxID=137267 RepID=A0AAE3VWI3_9ACTN|nr:acyl carrier protein [Catenuloplanes indicus]MDQ0364985.1 acyl carrier protein [Catenuloplanes indicus]